VNIFLVRANSKFQFVEAEVGKIHSETVTTKYTNALLLITCFDSLQLFDRAFSTFRVRFIKIIKL